MVTRGDDTEIDRRGGDSRLSCPDFRRETCRLRYQPNHLLGIGLLMLSTLLFVVMDAMVKYLVGDGLSPVQLLAVRSWMITLMIVAWLAARGQLTELHTRQPGIHLLRGCLGFVAPYTFFTALKTLPLADATVIFFSSTFVMTAASALFLGERVGPHRWAAVVVGFGGVVVAMNPGGGGDLAAYLLVLCATLAYALLFLSGRYLTRRDSVISVVLSFNLGVGAIATLLAPWHWAPLSTGMSLAIALVAVFAFAGHFAFSAAFARADVSLLAPFEYLALVWAVAIGYLVWGDVPTPAVWTGAAIIVAAGMYVIQREAAARRTLAGR